MDNNIVVAVTGFLIIVLFGVRPFVYKPATRLLSHEASAYFTAVWCLVFVLGSMPFFYDRYFIDGEPVFFTKGIIFPMVKGFSLFGMLRFNQAVNKESTSSSVFWGVISLALSALVTTFLLQTELSATRLAIVVFVGILGALFFSFGEGKNLTKEGKLAFLGITLCAVVNITCDTLTIRYANWYVLFTVPIVVMIVIGEITCGKQIKLKDFFVTKHIVLAGFLYALGEFILIFSMQSFFPVIAAVFLIRVAQSLDLILAYHLHKEGSARAQYFFALSVLALSYVFFFGLPI